MQEKQAFEERLKNILQNQESVSQKLASEGLKQEEFVKLSKQYADGNEIAQEINKYFSLKKDIEELEYLYSSEEDQEMKTMAKDELYEKIGNLKECNENIQILLLPKDVEDEKNAIVEIRAGVGGEESSLFAAGLFNMYEKYAASMGWKTETMSVSYSDLKGLKEIVFLVSGKGVFANLKFESGGHRIQRIPETESCGRIHTSAATVAVLPEMQAIDLKIEDKDLKIELCRSSGAGGQHVNTTDSAVRIVHLPTGIAVECQDERSQIKNKERALKVLYARVYDAKKAERDKERSEERKGQIGSGDRSERIRTYNYPQGRVTDHRINLTLYKIVEIIEEGRLDYVINELKKEERARKLAG